MPGRAVKGVELPPFLRRTSTRVTAAVGLTACALVGAATFLSERQTAHALHSAESFHLSSLAQLLVDTVRAPVAFEDGCLDGPVLHNRSLVARGLSRSKSGLSRPETG